MRENMKIYAHTHTRIGAMQVCPYLLTLTRLPWWRSGENAENSQCKRAMEPKQANKQTYKNHFPSLLSRHGKMSSIVGTEVGGSRHTTSRNNNTEPHK